jgi:hypothetical protein
MGAPVSAGAGRRPELLGQQLGVLPGREVAAAVDLVEVDEVVRVGALGPTAGGLVQLVGEHADGNAVAMPNEMRRSGSYASAPRRERAGRAAG